MRSERLSKTNNMERSCFGYILVFSGCHIRCRDEVLSPGTQSNGSEHRPSTVLPSSSCRDTSDASFFSSCDGVSRPTDRPTHTRRDPSFLRCFGTTRQSRSHRVDRESINRIRTRAPRKHTHKKTVFINSTITIIKSDET